MRMWMVEPQKMCKKHLLGEHCECHTFLGTLKKKGKLDGYILHNCLEPAALQSRHDKLAAELVRRGLNHNSELTVPEGALAYLPGAIATAVVDRNANETLLLNRCEECRSYATD